MAESSKQSNIDRARFEGCAGFAENRSYTDDERSAWREGRDFMFNRRNAGNSHPEMRYDGYKGRPIQPGWTDDQKAAWDEGRRARIIEPIEAVAKMIDKKADDFAQEHGYDDMGGLSFGRGQQADAKMDHHSTLVELAEEIRSIKLPDDMGYKSIDMVLHCPKCGMQHIDKDNYEELRIEAAELGVDREGERELERWIEEREWSNPPHRSHLCQNRKCGHIWRPADVPTNGVAAIKTAGTKDAPITSPSVEFQILKAEHDNLKSSYGRLKLAYDAWHEKTNWIHKTIKPAELGQHIADVMTARLLCLGDKMTAGVIDAKQMTLNAVDKAPKDGTVVLMWLEGSDIPHPARFQDGKWRSSWDGDEVNSMVGWMHIPNVVAVK